MKLHTNQKNVETNMSGAGSFSIKASAKAFSILSSGLYSDKIKAVVRELACNAIDSHVGANKRDTPITVHLPNVFEPFFSVRDYGLGLSKDQVLNLYTTYFESTKADSNDQIGALGLGSKSPFSYTDSFTVVSIFNGLQSTYSAYIGSNGEPCIQPLADSETDECNGVEVQFAVKSDDYDSFRNRAELIFRPFDVKPEITGNSEYEPKDRGNLKYEGNGWKFYESSYYQKDQVAIQGNIEYPLDPYNVNTTNDKQKFVLEQNVDINFELGELDISASRESLSYDELTQENIRKRLEIVYDELTGQISEKCATADTLYNASLIYNSMLEDFYNSRYLKDGLLWRGEEIPKVFNIPEGHDQLVSYFHNSRITTRVSRETTGTINPRDNYEFILNDIKTKGISRIRAYVAENPGSNVKMLAYKEQLEQIGNPTYTLASELPDSTIPSNYVPGSKTGKHFKRYSHYYSTSSWQFENIFETLDYHAIDPGDDVLYVPVTGKYCEISSLYTMYEVGKYIGIMDKKEIIGVKKSFIGTKKWDALIENHNFIRFDEYIKEHTDKLKDNYMLKSIIGQNFRYNDIKNNISTKTERILKVLKDNIDEMNDGDLKETVLEYRNMSKRGISSEMNSYVIHFFNRAMELSSESSFDFNDLIYKRYPMLELTDGWAVQEKNNKDKIISYINLVDSNIN